MSLEAEEKKENKLTRTGLCKTKEKGKIVSSSTKGGGSDLRKYIEVDNQREGVTGGRGGKVILLEILKYPGKKLPCLLINE